MPVKLDRQRWVSLRDATPEALQAEMERRQAEAEQAKRRKAEEAKQAEKTRGELLATVPGRVSALRKELAAAVKLGAEAGRPSPLTRSIAREALLAGDALDGAGQRPLQRLANTLEFNAADESVAAIYQVQLRAGRLLTSLHQAGAGGSDEAAQVDELECEAFRALTTRLRVLAGLEG